MIDELGYFYNATLLQRPVPKFGKFLYHVQAVCVKAQNLVGLGRRSDLAFLEMEQKLKNQTRELRDEGHPRKSIEFSPEEEKLYVEAMVSAENVNIWAILMPAVYQLVPGSLIARLWFNSLYPPPLVESTQQIEGTDLMYSTFAVDTENENVLYVLLTNLFGVDLSLIHI